MAERPQKEDVVSKKDVRDESEGKNYAKIVMERNRELNRAQVDKHRETREKETATGAVKTKHYDIRTYKGTKGRVLATKRYTVGVTKVQDGRKTTLYDRGI